MGVASAERVQSAVGSEAPPRRNGASPWGIVAFAAYLVALVTVSCFMFVAYLFIQTVVPFLLLGACVLIALLPRCGSLLARSVSGLLGLIVGSVLTLAVLGMTGSPSATVDQSNLQALSVLYLPVGSSLVALLVVVVVRCLKEGDRNR